MALFILNRKELIIIASLKDIICTGVIRCLNKIYAKEFVGKLTGNADTATALTTSAGSATQPVYFSGGKPVDCKHIRSFISIMRNDSMKITISTMIYRQSSMSLLISDSIIFEFKSGHGVGRYSLSFTGNVSSGYSVTYNLISGNDTKSYVAPTVTLSTSSSNITKGTTLNCVFTLSNLDCLSIEYCQAYTTVTINQGILV